MYDRAYYLANRDKAIAKAMRWRKENPEKFKEIQQRSGKAVANRLRDEVFSRYGGAKCVCCGETEILFLTLDHIDGGGNKHRREQVGGSGSGEKLYRWLRDHNYPDGFQVLCWNCNCGRARNGGICPHKMTEDTER